VPLKQAVHKERVVHLSTKGEVVTLYQLVALKLNRACQRMRAVVRSEQEMKTLQRCAIQKEVDDGKGREGNPVERPWRRSFML
jgi:hypothetical protein